MSSFPFLSKYYLIHPHYRQDHVLFYYLGVFCVESSKLSILGGDGRAVAHHVQPLQVQEIHHLFLLLKIPILSNRHLFSKLLVLHLPIKGKIIFAFSRRHLTGNIHQVLFFMNCYEDIDHKRHNTSPCKAWRNFEQLPPSLAPLFQDHPCRRCLSLLPPLLPLLSPSLYRPFNQNMKNLKCFHCYQLVGRKLTWTFVIMFHRNHPISCEIILYLSIT